MGLAKSKSAGQATVGATGSALLILGLTALTMLAFAANSLFTRLALQTSPIDPASFTAIRIVTGALTLGLIARLGRARITTSSGSMVSAGLLFAYAAAFSFAYRGMDTGVGALVLFASAQLLMIGYGYAKGEKTNILGLVFALSGLVVFLAPSSSAPPFASAGLMVVAGLAWGAYSLMGRASGSPVSSTAGSFIWAAPLSAGLALLHHQQLTVDPIGSFYATLSGCVTSALGYVVWYWVRVRMTAISAGTVQLSVPVLSALLGVLALGEHVSLRSRVSGFMVLLGVALTVISTRER